MDPLSIIAGVVGIATAALQSSVALHDVLKAIKNAPRDIEKLSDETKDLSSIIESLQSTLKDDDYKQTLCKNDRIINSLEQLKGPLKTFSAINMEIEKTLKPYLKLTDDGRSRKISDWKWLWAKGGINDLLVDFQHSKQTLNLHMSNVTMQCTLRLIASDAGSQLERPTIDRQDSTSTNAGGALRRYVAEKLGGTPEGSFEPGREQKYDAAAQSFESRDTTADIAKRMEKLSLQRTALFDAVKDGQHEIVEMLLQDGIDVNATARDGQTALHLSAEYGHEAVTQILLEYGAKVDLRMRPGKADKNWNCPGGRVPLHYAAINGHLGIINMLLNHGADASSQSINLRTPLQEAIAEDRTAAATLLIKRRASLTISDHEDWTPLHCAAYKNNLDIVKALIASGADLEARTSDWNAKGKERWRRTTPLFLAVWNGQIGVVHALLSADADPRAHISDGATCLHAAVYGKRRGAWIAGMLLDADAKRDGGKDVALINMKKLDGNTALHVAAAKGRVDMVGLLLKRGADVRVVNELGRDVLQHAKAAKGSEAVVSLLEENVSGTKKTKEAKKKGKSKGGNHENLDVEPVNASVGPTKRRHSKPRSAAS